jgi:predicted lipoprotein with Yx(FWY)xxD motif
MSIFRTARFRGAGTAALVGVALLVAGCGSSSSTSSASQPAANTSSSASASNAAATGVSIGMTKGSAGSYLTGSSGRAVYLWVADSGDRSSCAGACAKAWPPVIAKGKPIAAHGVNAKDLTTIARPDGSKQVAYNGHPLYYFVEDSSSGMTKGQGSDSFGAKWWLVAPSGAAIKSGSSSGSGASSAGASGSGSSGSGSSGGSSSGGGWG